MVTPIIRVTPATSQAGNLRNTAPAPAEVSRPQASQSADTVELSPEARVRLLESQGRTVPEIAAFLNLTPQAVSNFLQFGSAAEEAAMARDEISNSE